MGWGVDVHLTHLTVLSHRKEIARGMRTDFNFDAYISRMGGERGLREYDCSVTTYTEDENRGNPKPWKSSFGRRMVDSV